MKNGASGPRDGGNLAIYIKLLFNLSHFTVQSQPYCTVISAILRDKMAEIET